MDAKVVIIIILLIGMGVTFVVKDQEVKDISSKLKEMTYQKESLQKTIDAQSQSLLKSKNSLQAMVKLKTDAERNNLTNTRQIKKEEEIIQSLVAQTEVLQKEIALLKEPKPVVELTMEEKRLALLARRRAEKIAEDEARVAEAQKRKKDVLAHERKLEMKFGMDKN